MNEEYYTAQFILNTVRDCLYLNLPDEQAKTTFQEQLHISGEDWKAVEESIDRESGKWKRGFMALRVWKLQASYTITAVNKVVAENFPGATRCETDFISEQIVKEATAQSLHFDYPLSSMLTEGLQGVRKHRRSRRLKGILRHTWTAIKAVLAVVIVLGVFSKLQSDFEAIVVSLLLLAYTGIIRSMWSNSLIGADFNFAGLMRYFIVKKLLGYWPNDEECEAQWKIQEGAQVAKTRWIITDTGNTIINLIVFWHLFKMLV